MFVCSFQQIRQTHLALDITVYYKERAKRVVNG